MSWKITHNFAGVSTVEASNGFSLPEGFYKCKTVETAQNENGNLKVTTEIQGPTNQGTKLSLTAGTDFSKEINARRFKTMLVSHGISASKLDQGEVDITEKTLLGKICYVYYKPKAEGQQYDERRFVTKENFDEMTSSGSSSDDGEVTVAHAAMKNGKTSSKVISLDD